MLEVAQKYLQLKSGEYYKCFGKVDKVVGLTIESIGPKAKLNDLCMIFLDKERRDYVMSEVVGFKDSHIILMPFDNVEGVGVGCIVENTGHPLTVAVGDELLGHMEYTSLIFPGDKIDIFASGLSDNSTSYKSSFSDKLTDSMWEITMPVDSGRVVLFQLGTQFDFIIYTQNKTILKSSAIVRQRYRKENMYFLAIELINNLEKIQRRQFFRLPCTIDMDFYEVRYDDKAESELEFCKKMYKNHAINSKNMNTVKSVILDISGGGIRFSLSTPLEEGTYFMAQFSLALEECTQQFNIVCKVINCTQSLDYADRYFARSKFIFDRMTEREKIVRFVFEEERRIRRREME